MQAIQLPSKFIPYDKKEFRMRTFVGADEKLLASITYDTLEQKFAEVLKNCSEGIDPKELTAGDRMYLLIWQAIHSYSKDYEADYVCEHCLENIHVNIDLSQLEVKELPDDYKEPYPVKLSDGTEVNLRLFRVKDEIQIARYEKNNKDSWLYHYATSIVDDSKNIMEKVLMLEKMPTRDLAVIRAFHEEFVHGPIMQYKYTCSNCGGEGLMPVPFRLELILPAGKTVIGSVRNRV